ncbi:hypothetical protein R1sor_019075 [Riccia sorocarpa]|uniref:Uncharacterized protein n=1 Tax=Riccia sorocarpa TaxID=122646 RepID=A0ABD3IBK4_9MARC
MSKAFGWLKGRTKDKSSRKNSASSSAGSDRKHSGEWESETESDSKPSELENPFRGKINRDIYRDYEPYGQEIGGPSEAEYGGGKWRGQGDFTTKSDDGWQQAKGTRGEYRDWRQGPRSQREGSSDSRFDDGRPQMKSDTALRDFEKPGRFLYPGRSSQDSRSSSSTGGNSLDEPDRQNPLQRRSNTMGQLEGGRPTYYSDRRQQSYSYSEAGEHSPGAKEIHPATPKFDFLLLNWPKLKSASVEKSRFEGRLLSMIEVETEVEVVGEEPTKERWSLGLVDDGVKALARAIATRGYPKLRKMSFKRCRLIFDSSFATLAKAITASNLPNLEELSFQHISYINSQGFLDLARALKTGGQFSRLTALILVDNGMQDDGLIALARQAFGSGNLSSLKKLHVGSANTGKAKSEEFHLEAAREFAQELSSSGHLPQLEDLRFSGCVHWTGAVSVVEALESRVHGAITHLDLSDTPLGSEGMRVLARALEAAPFSSLLSLKLEVTVEEIPVLFEAFQLRNLAYEHNNCLVARLNIGKWPMEELYAEYEKNRISNMELEELV